MNHHDPSGKVRPVQRWLAFAAAALLAFTVAGCGGDDGAAGAAGAPGAPGANGKDADPTAVAELTAKVAELTQAANPEICVTCHTGANPIARTGPNHQQIYDDFYQDGVVKIVPASMVFATNGTDTATLQFELTKAGAPFDCTKPVYSSRTNPEGKFAIGSYWAAYDVATKTFTADLSLVGTRAYNVASNVCTISKTGVTPTQIAQMAGNGIVQLYGVDEILTTNAAAHLIGGKYPFAGVLKVGTVDFSSAANVTGCENCHTRPYLKHTYIYGKVVDNTGAPTEFYTCKGCHYDERNGGHIDWQILKDDPVRYAEINAGSPITAAERTKYAYKAKLMNDVHMSHAMEFAYPQSMTNCVTCHAGKLDVVLADDKFQAETCQSCHAVDGLKAKLTAATWSHGFIADDPRSVDCSAVCHKTTGGNAPSFKTIHKGGFDAKIYTAAGERYSETFKVTIDSASVANNIVTVKFHATESADIAGMAVTDITPTVLIGLYGYNSKDFIVAAHGRDADRNRLLEYVVGSTHPRFTTVSAANGSWEVTADLSMWADQIAAGTIKRAEIAVMPELKNASGLVLGLNAPSRTFDLGRNAFDDAYFSDIVDVTGGCNTCHAQLATTFHSGNRGGNIKVCRICHEVSSAGSHLELQSRSIDSYVHGIHTFQAFDPGNIDFGDPVESLAYEHHIGTSFPTFGVLNCEACHKPGMYNLPNQAKSMPGVLSGTDDVAGRNIGTIPGYVTGPAVRACGGCHRAQKINADDSGGLAILNQHFKTFGYLAEDVTGVWDSIVAKMMGLFK